MKKERIRVGFTKEQHAIVKDFLQSIRRKAEMDLGAPVHVRVEWGGENLITLTGKNAKKEIKIEDVLEHYVRATTPHLVGE